MLEQELAFRQTKENASSNQSNRNSWKRVRVHWIGKTPVTLKNCTAPQESREVDWRSAFYYLTFLQLFNSETSQLQINKTDKVYRSWHWLWRNWLCTGTVTSKLRSLIPNGVVSFRLCHRKVPKEPTQSKRPATQKMQWLQADCCARCFHKIARHENRIAATC